jgi:hypothetical protein
VDVSLLIRHRLKELGLVRRSQVGLLRCSSAAPGPPCRVRPVLQADVAEEFWLKAVLLIPWMTAVVRLNPSIVIVRAIVPADLVV